MTAGEARPISNQMRNDEISIGDEMKETQRAREPEREAANGIPIGKNLSHNKSSDLSKMPPTHQ